MPSRAMLRRMAQEVGLRRSSHEFDEDLSSFE